MKGRPILFSGEMVRAILEGRKTQTRRVVKYTCAGHVKEPNGNRRWLPDDPDAVLACPYGQPGDRLWVRETWAKIPTGEYVYRADIPAKDEALERQISGRGDAPWKPSIHMPRRASRITLEIVSVRIERLCDITKEDTKAEGVIVREPDVLNAWLAEWIDLWDSINAARGFGWEKNPRVWVVEFKQLEGGQ